MRIFSLHAVALALATATLAAPLDAQASHVFPGVPTLPAAQVPAGRVAVRFMGTSTILLDDGTTQILVDGFFSRPGVLLLPIAPNKPVIESAMARAQIGNRLKAVLVAHSHYDHVLDAPAVARLTGARLVGSESTANVGRGGGLPNSQIDIIRHLQELDFGDFHVTVFRSPHAPNMVFPGEIVAPLAPPKWASSYREGGSYSFLVTHHGFSILIHPSANVSKDLYKDVRADVVFLGIGGLINQKSKFFWGYLWELRRTGTRVVIPIHWDDFTKPLSAGLRLPPKSTDDVAMTMKGLQFYAKARHFRLRTMPLFDPVDIEAAPAP
jgi:L-ascorbate metabolism protein UlaG (beta-lactamase superfamily)